MLRVKGTGHTSDMRQGIKLPIDIQNASDKCMVHFLIYRSF